jgi:hypothetical protein
LVFLLLQQLILLLVMLIQLRQQQVTLLLVLQRLVTPLQQQPLLELGLLLKQELLPLLVLQQYFQLQLMRQLLRKAHHLPL